MKRVLPIVVLAVVTALSASVVTGAPKREKRAYKPSERRQRQQAAEQQAAEQQPAQNADAASAAGGTYEEEIQAAKEQRDRDLENAAAQETNRRRLEERKSQIFAQYAAIVAALRDKYQASQGQDGAAPPAKQPKIKGAKANRQPPAAQTGAKQASPAKGKDGGRKSKNAAGSLADAQQKLDEENSRHAAKLEELNGQLRQAETSANKRDVRRAEKAIEKENNSHNARRTILERRVTELGGSVAASRAVEN